MAIADGRHRGFSPWPGPHPEIGDPLTSDAAIMNDDGDGAIMNENGMEARFNAAREIARDAGRLALKHFLLRDTLKVETKGVHDLVSEADRDVEALISSRLMALFPDDGFIGEETGVKAGGMKAAGIWVVDPIDGTASFLDGIPAWCVSIAYVVGSEIEIGVIYDPNAEELFAARRGHGATLNDRPIRARRAGGFKDGRVGIGYSLRVDPRPTVTAIERLLTGGGMYVWNGSGALMLAYVAAGRLIGYYEAHINAWDCLAGIGLIREAGGWTNDFLADDGLIHGNVIAAGAPGLAEAMRHLAGLN